MSDHYILDENHNVIPAELMIWAMWFNDMAKRRVDNTIVGDVRVSTVFLGLDHGIDDDHPLVFETMIFGGPEDQYTDRCSTWDEALAMHKKACELAFPKAGA